MCGQYDDPTFDPALFDPPTRGDGPLEPLMEASEEQQQRDRVGFDEYIDNWSDPKAYADGVPYTPAEATIVRELISAAAEGDPGEGNE